MSYYNAATMTETEVHQRFYPHVKFGVTRSSANAHLQDIMARPRTVKRSGGRAFRSLVSKFNLRIKACKPIIR